LEWSIFLTSKRGKKANVNRRRIAISRIDYQPIDGDVEVVATLKVRVITSTTTLAGFVDTTNLFDGFG
jgi:hypothetical protein